MKRKKSTDINKDTLTKYYKATYAKDKDRLMSEVFAESSMDRAQEYASGDNARGKTAGESDRISGPVYSPYIRTRSLI